MQYDAGLVEGLVDGSHRRPSCPQTHPTTRRGTRRDQTGHTPPDLRKRERCDLDRESFRNLLRECGNAAYGNHYI